MNELDTMKVAELKALAAEKGLKLPTTLRKAEIIAALQAEEKAAAGKKKAPAKKEGPSPKTAAKPEEKEKAKPAKKAAAQPKTGQKPAKAETKPETAQKPAKAVAKPEVAQKPAKAEVVQKPAKAEAKPETVQKPAPARAAAQPKAAQRPLPAKAETSPERRNAPETQRNNNRRAPQQQQRNSANNRQPQRTNNAWQADRQRPAAQRTSLQRPAAEKPALPDAVSRQGNQQNLPARPANAPTAPVVQSAPAMPVQAAQQPIPAPVVEPIKNDAEKELLSDAPQEGQNRESTDCSGILDIHADGYGFLRINNYLPGPGDIYVSNTMIRRFALRSGDYIEGKTFVQKNNERNSALVFISRVNGFSIDNVFHRKRFEDLIPVYPDARITLEPPTGNCDLAIRLIDILAPIGFGQRGMIVSPPKAGKTTLLKKIANAVSANHPDAHLMVLLIDERPEEVTDMQRSVDGEVLASTFDQQPEHHARLAEMALDRAQRLVECGKNVVVLLDSITRLSRAYNLIIPSTGRSLSGGLDPGALYKPKRFFGAARNIEHGGSLTVLATALVDTGSRMDDIIFEEFKGTGNMEIVLDRKLSERRIFPAIDLAKSGTRREELLLSQEEMDGVLAMRKVLQGNNGTDSTDQLISMMMKSSNNSEFFQRLKGWVSIWEKEGFVMQNR